MKHDPWSVPGAIGAVIAGPISFNSKGCLSIDRVGAEAGSEIVGAVRSSRTGRVYFRTRDGRMMSAGLVGFE